MLGLPDTDLALLTTKQCQARLHVDFLGALQPEKLQAKIDASGRWTHAVGFRPTGNRPHTAQSAQSMCCILTVESSVSRMLVVKRNALQGQT